MTESGTGQMAEPSIHWRRRWWYALWVALLLGTAGFWRWWETPAVFGAGHAILTIRMADLPPGTKVEAWTGPVKAWSADATGFQGPWVAQDAAKPLPIPPLEIQVGLRRWHQGYIPRLTSDLIVLRLDPPQGPSKFIAYSLKTDLNSGLAGPHHRLSISAPVRWSALSVDASRPSPLLP